MRTMPLLALLAPALVAQAPELTHGPFRGHVGPTALHVWARASQPGAYTLILTNLVDGTQVRVAAAAAAEHDHVLHFAASDLPAGSAHTLRIVSGDHVVHDSGGTAWTTALPDAAGTATLAFGSCANERSHREQPIWARILAKAPHGLVLLGDTPYIDLGTLVARRSRHRDFFAHPPIAAALRAIPTWTTWDDHDYTANDEFGAVPGSETARPVFVEYHAHADYGDGGRGIWTRFRQGPIEVFLLDARTLADSGDSPLAPGERTLLGAAQIEWLQQGLRASRAPIKVLACGMVWNGGVRPGKKDHWGNWLPERDALFRWLGANDIGGVVLVGGDVHRSRVLVHPTAAIVGYDLPEFVTSPLAQNVIETNAVPVPGLAFDAGEPHSCLFLSASVVDGETTLRAVFQAGDGREFHTREFAPGALERPDAAAGYRRAVGHLRAAFGERLEHAPELEHVETGLDPSPVVANTVAWRNAVAAAGPAFAAWQQALALERCRFRATSGEPGMSEYMQDLFLPLRQLATLGIACVLQAVADGDDDGTVRGVGSLLGLARHLQQEPGSIAWAVAAGLERTVGLLHAHVVATRGAAVGDRVRALVRDHLAARPGIAAASAAMRIELFRLFESTMDALRLGDDRQSQAARTLATEVRRAFVARVEPLLAPGDAATEQNLATTRAEFERLGAELAAAAKERQQALADLRAKGTLGPDAGTDLALLLARLLTPNLGEHLQAQADAVAVLRAISGAR